MKKENVLIVYHYIAKYRKPVFLELSNSNHYDWAISADKVSNNDIKLVEDDFYSRVNFFKIDNRWFLNKFLFQRNLFNQIDRCNPKVVVFLADPYFLSTWLLSCWLRLTGRKVVFWTHGFIRGKSIADRLKLIFYKIPNAIFLYGDKAKLNLIERGVPASKLYPIYNSLDYQNQVLYRASFNDDIKFDIRSELFGNPNIPVLYFVGRLTFIKKIDLLIQLVGRLDSEGIPVNLLIIGTGEADSVLKAQANQLKIKYSSVKFYGQTYDEAELSKLIMSSDLCVAPGEVGLTAMHSLGYGVPVVTHSNYNTQMPEYEAIIDGYTGRLFEDDNFESMVAAVKLLISEPIPDVKLNCINIIESKYTPAAQLKFIESAIKNVIEN